MKTILDIKKARGEAMSSFSKSLEGSLMKIGLKKAGLFSQPRGPDTFPLICGFETLDGIDGGFILDYSENRKVMV